MRAAIIHPTTRKSEYRKVTSQPSRPKPITPPGIINKTTYLRK